MSGNREFYFRRLHSLLGVIPVGIFLIQHLVVNQFAARGADAFNKAAGFMDSLPFRYALEIFIIFLPLIYHAVYGVYIAFTAKNNAGHYSYFRNWMFVLQRVTGILTLIFVSWHVWQTRIAAQMGAEVNFDMMANILSSPFMLGFYIVGVLSVIFPLFKRLMVFCGHMGDHGHAAFSKNFDLRDADYIFSAFIRRFKSDFCVCVRELDY